MASYSKTLRLVRAFVGPLGRIRTVNGKVQIGVQTGEGFAVLGEGVDYVNAFQNTFWRKGPVADESA